MKKFYSIAIDGPAAAGKSSVAKILANRFNLIYIDTGAMYRAFTYAVLKNNLDPQNEEESCKLIGKVDIELLENGKVFVNNEDVTKQIRDFNVSSNVSYIASYKLIRLEMVKLQRKMAEKGNVIMDGRDIGTTVFPDAELKIFVTASPEIRAQRRYDELKGKGQEANFDDILENVKQRDYIDQHREVSPLRKADDALLLDNSHMTIAEQKRWLTEQFNKITAEQG